MTKNLNKVPQINRLSMWLGLGLLVAIIFLVVFIPCPSQSQYLVFRIILAFAAAGLAAVIPGVLNVNLKNGITASGAIAVAVIVYFFNPAAGAGDFKCAAETFSYTVFIHGKQGREDIILRNQGAVLLHLNSKPERVNIDGDGKAIFTELSPTFLNQKVRITIYHPQPYQSINPDSLYVLEKNGVTYVSVELKGTDKIQGEVTDFVTGEYIDSVRISILDIETYTNGKGWFSLTIPPGEQAKFQRVVFDKKGYQREVYDSVPVHTKQLFSVSLKHVAKH
ncbi:MAG: hypothetical protein ABI707_18650 [Ferruginibacter sp.]